MNLDDAITRACNYLGIIANRDGLKNLKAGLMGINGGADVDSFNRLIDDLKAQKGPYDRFSVDDILTAYETKIMRLEGVKCDFCKGGGWLKVILIEGRHNGIDKTYVWHYWQPERYWRFIQHNKTFKARQAVLPCYCDNGSRHNSINGFPWLTDEQRAKFSARAIVYQGQEASAAEDYYQAETIKAINAGGNYIIKKLSDYPDINTLKQQLKEILEGEV